TLPGYNAGTANGQGEPARASSWHCRGGIIGVEWVPWERAGEKRGQTPYFRGSDPFSLQLGRTRFRPGRAAVHICLYTETALPKGGGHELVVAPLARAFQDLGHGVPVLAPQPRLPLRAPARRRDRDLPYRMVRHPRFYSARFLVD